LPMKSLDFSIAVILPAALRLCKGRPARKPDNFTVICEPMVYKMWEPRHLNPIGLHGLLLG
jgi:hypothetical protein